MNVFERTIFRSVMVAVFGLWILSGTDAHAQYKGNPVKKDKLISVLRSRQLQTREIVDVIKSNGVDFRVTQPVEVELVGAGARPEVIAAAKSNYRAGTAPLATKGVESKFTGKPLDKDDIITLLENDVADAQVRRNVQSRGVSFKPSSQDKADIKTAGGSVALINAITASYVDPDRNASVASRDDDDIVVSTVTTDAQKTQASIGTLQQAVQNNPDQARNYQQLGFMYLYGLKNFGEAERYMREAIDRGGSAVFRVFHSHDATMQEVCEGSLYIARDTVRFEADDNIHTFETTDANIKKVEMQGFWKSAFKSRRGTFKFKFVNEDREGFVFAPLTNNDAESKMIIRLVGKK